MPWPKQNFLLLGASYFFYGFWDYRFLWLMVFTSSFDYWSGRKIEDLREDSREKPGGFLTPKKFLVFSLLVNFGVLGFFKYFNFFSESFAAFLKALGFRADFVTLNIILPVGISFYTFQSVSYVIDVYRGQTKACRNIFDFLLFVSFFPQLIAGPIERSKNLLTQIQKPRQVAVEDFQKGLWLILWGCFCKVFVADNLWPYTAWVSNPDSHPAGADLWIGGIAWSFQFYCDFAGYSRIARGMAHLMGFKLVTNFRYPFFSRSPSEYWQRWHISLSFWFRDYLYGPLKKTLPVFKRPLALLITFTLIGLWHGPNWNFIIWGLEWGLVLILADFIKLNFGSSPIFSLLNRWPLLQVLLTFMILNLLNSMLLTVGFSDLFTLQKGLLLDWQVSSRSLRDLIAVLFYVTPMLILDLVFYLKADEYYFEKRSIWIRLALYAYLVFFLIGGAAVQSHDFLYFQF